MLNTSCRRLSGLINPKIGKIPVSPTLHINETMKQIKNEGKQVYHFGFGQSPFPVPDPVVKSLQKYASEKDYLPTRGLPQLREIISNHLQREFGVSQFSSEGILIGPGSKQLLYQLFLLFRGEVMLASPSWVSYYPQCVLADKKTTILETSRKTNWHVTPEELEKKILQTDASIPKLLLLNSPCNPTGQCYTKGEMVELTKIFRKYNITLIADEIYGLLNFEGNYTSFSSVYPEGTIISSGISKAQGAGGWRLGYVAVPPELHEFLHPMDCVASETFSAVSAPIQYAAIDAFQSNKDIDVIMKKQRQILRGVSRYVYDSLSNIGVEVLPAKGGFYMFPDFEKYRGKLEGKGIHTSEDFCSSLLSETGVGLLPGSAFLKEKSSLTARLAFVNFDGGIALENFGDLPLEKPVPESFVRDNCKDTVKGIDIMCSWVSHL